MDTDRTGYAYDPVRHEDVQIRCSPQHRSTETEAIDGRSLPVLIASDFSHDPHEGCQGSYTVICEIDGDCPNCGYDRQETTVITLAGEQFNRCQACGIDPARFERRQRRNDES